MFSHTSILDFLYSTSSVAMASVKRVKKLQANKNYEKGCFFVCNLVIVYALTGLACSLFWSYPFWFSSVSCCMTQVLFIRLLYIWSSFSNNPKWLFVVVNVIIVVLVGESNFLGSKSSSLSAVDQYYDKYVERSKRLSGLDSNYNTVQEKKEVKMDKKDQEEEEEDEEEVGLPAQELNKRVEEFIARVNKQRWLEEKSIVCCPA